MNREDIIRMAEEAGFFIQQNEIYSMSTQSDQELTAWIERFAALVASAEREKYEAIITNMTKLLEAQQKREGVAVDMIAAGIAAEREACAEVCKKHADFYAGLEPSPIAQSAWAACIDNRDTILARGQA